MGTVAVEIALLVHLPHKTSVHTLAPGIIVRSVEAQIMYRFIWIQLSNW